MCVCVCVHVCVCKNVCADMLGTFFICLSGRLGKVCDTVGSSKFDRTHME